MPTDPIQKDPPSGCAPWAWLLGIVSLIALVSSLSQGERATDAAETANEAVVNMAAPQLAAEAEPAINEGMLRLAARHAGLAIGADGIEGASIYSLNCWAAADRTFSLIVTERCVAFDTLVAMTLPTEAAADPWFAEDLVNTRYTTLLSSHDVGLAGTTARLERLRVAAAVQTVKPVTAPITTETDADSDVSMDSENEAALEDIDPNMTGPDI